MPNEDHNQNDLNNELDEFQDEINENSEQYDAIEDIEISKEMRDSFLDYSMSVIVQRALPDVRDGMKPVHRRILYAMSRLNMTPGSAHKKVPVSLVMLSVNTIHTGIQRFMKLWFVWPRISPIAIHLSMDMETSVPSMETAQQPCDIPKRECQRFQWKWLLI